MGFSASLSGLNANQQKLSVIGNNLANINTIAFKASTVTFSDLVSQTVGGSGVNPMQVGLGVTTGSISPNFGQGGIENTGVPTNVAIQGSGFFVVGDTENRSYTRAGNFSFDADGMLITPDGQPVQGYSATDPLSGQIITTGQPSSIVVPPGVLRAPTATTQFGTVTNLNLSAAVNDTFTASVQIYDTLGVAHVATITYSKTAGLAWDYNITVPRADVTTGTPAEIAAGTPASIKTGSLVFSAGGALTSPAADVAIAGPAWASGATATALTWKLLDANAVPSLTGYAAPSATSSVTQNGAAAGTISGISITAEGELVATFGAGKTFTVAQLALCSFNNPQGLVKLGSNRFGESEAAGMANVGVAGTGGRGTLIGSSLEQSNVDVAQEFTQMILAQRGYQANSKSITTADELLVDTLNLKR
jgi:flagellar hook protein FlgE